jgi:hypothetical protein
MSNTPAKNVMMQDSSYMQKLKAKAKVEFRDWKATLKRMIDRGSELRFDEKTGNYVFVLPGEIIQIVTEVLIKERVKLEKHPDQKAALRAAMKQLNNELSMAASAVLSREDGAKPKDPDAEEAEAKKVLEKMRAELVQGLD